MKNKRFAWLEKVDEHEWKFDFSRDKWNSDEDLDRAIQKMDSDPQMAKRIFVSLLSTYPYHFDAYHHMALILGHERKYEEAFELRKTGVEKGFSLFPKEFDLTRDKLEWLWLENRPFLRLLHGLAIDYRFVQKDRKKEVEIYEQLLKFDPEDHQGCRLSATGCYFKLGMLDKILELGKAYKDDASPEIIYGQVLAYLMLGKHREAETYLKEALEYSPNVAKQILDKNHTKPKTEHGMEGYISMGGEDEAYLYWMEFGEYWDKTSNAIEFVRSHIRHK